ncbi:MAG: leucyl/phenylalanyl-tRNA--protein transferase [Helicobacteraceae bacterium]|jgi:leucyl/phenylalanyl-tRNA--protein transferase|nr:leucyl/phenylalanyl-tRNA--protein transferase [Helicobacteraceae bacterium]
MFDFEIDDRFDDLIAIGGDLTPENLIAAYRKGIFPWFIDDRKRPYWYCPIKRMILRPSEIKVSKSLAKILRKNVFEITCDLEFPNVMLRCAAPRKREKTSWINAEFIKNYAKLNESKIAHSVEARQDGELVGGLYGLQIGRVFFGESMFALSPNASKAALAFLCGKMPFGDLDFIDCQVPSEHLASMGGKLIDRGEFLKTLAASLGEFR